MHSDVSYCTEGMNKNTLGLVRKRNPEILKYTFKCISDNDWYI